MGKKAKENAEKREKRERRAKLREKRKARAVEKKANDEARRKREHERRQERAHERAVHRPMVKGGALEEFYQRESRDDLFRRAKSLGIRDPDNMSPIEEGA